MNATAQFCSSCGRPTELSEGEGVLGTEPMPEGEIRHLSVLFCDLVGSTPLSESLSLDDLHDLMRSYQSICADAIRRFDGHISQILGDGLLVFFGYPEASENDAERAASAALAILEEIERRNLEAGRGGIAIEVRVAVHSGPVLIGEVGGAAKKEPQALGATLNRAARMQDEADVGTAVVSAETLKLIQGAFIVREMGERNLKGIGSTPIYQLLRARAVRSRDGDLSSSGQTPFIGRRQELDLLLDRFHQTRDGTGQAILLRGGEGVGKSRLLAILRDELAEAPHTWLECRCSPFRESSTFHPLADLFERSFDIQREEPHDQKLAKIETILRATRTDRDRIVPALAELLGIPLPSRYPKRPATPEARRQLVLQSLTDWLFDVSEEQPVILVVEDLQWIDPSSREFVNSILAQCPTGRLMIVMSYRSDFDPACVERSYVAHLSINPLTRHQVTELVRSMAGDVQLDADLVDGIADRSDGVPLFAEELTHAMLDAGRGSPSTAATFSIPTTLQDLLMARLDRLGPAKEVAQLASVIGRDFSGELLRGLWPGSDGVLEAALARLLQEELVYRRGSPPRERYVFKHALIQETAYSSQLARRRLGVHQRIAELCESRFQNLIAIEPDWIARHYEEASLPLPAITLYRAAGQQAMDRSAHEEGIRHISRAIELLESLADHQDEGHEVQLQMDLGAHMMAFLGYADPETEQAFARARALCSEDGDPEKLGRALSGLATFYQVKGDLKSSIDLANQLLALPDEGTTGNAVWGHLALGSPLLWSGELEKAIDHLSLSASLHDSREGGFSARPQDPGVVSRAHAALAHWMRGHADVALQLSRDAIRRATGLAHPFDHATAVAFGALLRLWCRESDEAERLADECIALSDEHHFTLWSGTGRIVKGWALTERDRRAEGTALVEEGLGTLASTGASIGRPQVLALLARIKNGDGNKHGALLLIDDGLRLAQDGIRYWEAELHRVRGEILATGPDADACFREAIRVAIQQGAGALELRARTSLTRFLREAGAASDETTALSECCARLASTFEGVDLREARRLTADRA